MLIEVVQFAQLPYNLFLGYKYNGDAKGWCVARR